MPQYRVTYETTLSVSVLVDAEDNDAAQTEEESQGVVEEYLNSLALGLGANRLTADASVDGQAPVRVVRMGEDGQEAEVVMSDDGGQVSQA